MTRLPDWLLQTLSLDPTILPPVLTESTVPPWLYWTITFLHALPGLLVGLLAGWFVVRPMNAILGWLLRGFNRAFEGLTTFYAWTIGLALRGSALVLLVYVGLVGLTCWAFTAVPTGFLPEMDQGRLMASLQLPDGEALELTKDVMAKVDKITHDNPGVAHTITNVGSGGGGSASNWASMYVILKPFEERQSPDRSTAAIIKQLKAAWDKKIPEAKVTVNGAAPIPGLSQSGGFNLVVEDRGGVGVQALQQQTETLTAELAKHPGLNNVVTNFRPHTPQLLLNVDRDKVEAFGVPLSDVNQTMQMYLGSSGAGNFDAFGRTWQVTLQAAGQYRNNVEDVGQLQVRNNKGEMVPVGVLVNLVPQDGPLSLQRYNLHSAASITGNLGQGVSSGEAISNIEATAERTRQPGMGTEWTALMYLQIRAGNTALVVFALAVLCVFLALAALYESWTMPLAVILVVPMCLLCAGGSVGHEGLGQHLCADRPGGPGRAGVQERHPGRRVRPEVAPGRQNASRGSRGSVSVAPPAHYDDILRLHSGGCATRPGHGRGSGDAPFLGDGRVQRHDRCDPVRRFPHPGIFLRHPGIWREPMVQRPSRSESGVVALGRSFGPGRRLLPCEVWRGAAAVGADCRRRGRRAPGAGRA